MQIQSNKASQFLEYVKNYSPESQVMRFLNLIDTNRKELALTTADYFLSLCLDKNLIGSYKTIVKKLDLAEDPIYRQEGRTPGKCSQGCCRPQKAHCQSLEQRTN
jgi:hypothetical protein